MSTSESNPPEWATWPAQGGATSPPPPPADGPTASRPWWKKKRFIIPGVLIVVMVIAAALGGGASEDGERDTAADVEQTTSSTAADTTESTAVNATSTTAEETTTTEAAEPESLFPGRPDAQEEDQERNVGESAELSGYTATVNAAEFMAELSTFETAGYVKVNVTVLNRDEGAQPFSVFDWRLQTPGGQVLDPTFVSVPGMLESGDLVGGGEVTGDVYFEVGTEKGDFYILYKPDPFDAARGVWRVTVS